MKKICSFLFFVYSQSHPLLTSISILHRPSTSLLIQHKISYYSSYYSKTSVKHVFLSLFRVFILPSFLTSIFTRFSVDHSYHSLSSTRPIKIPRIIPLDFKTNEKKYIPFVRIFISHTLPTSFSIQSLLQPSTSPLIQDNTNHSVLF